MVVLITSPSLLHLRCHTKEGRYQLFYPIHARSNVAIHPIQEVCYQHGLLAFAIAMGKNTNNDDHERQKKTIQIIKIVIYVLIQVTFINIIKYL